MISKATPHNSGARIAPSEILPNKAENATNPDGFASFLTKYGGISASKPCASGLCGAALSFEELTPTLLRELVEKIVAHEAEDIDGKRHQNIDIYYSFVGKIDLPGE